jgi:hypothetical protein
MREVGAEIDEASERFLPSLILIKSNRQVIKDTSVPSASLRHR